LAIDVGLFCDADYWIAGLLEIVDRVIGQSVNH
jgi:hypothetical protein